VRPTDNPPNSDGLGVYHGTVPEWAVQVYWQPGPPIWQRFGLDPDPDPKWRSGTVANTSHTDASRCFQMLPDRLNAMQCGLRCSETTFPVLPNAPEVVEQNTRIFWRVYSCPQNATKSNYYNVQISELLGVLGVLAVSPRLFRCTLNLEAYSPEVIFIMFKSNSTIRVTIFLLHTLIQACKFNIQSSRYLNPQDYLQGIRYWFHEMQHCLAPNVPVQQLLRQVQYAFYHSVWQPGWTHQHNQPNHADLCTLLESPPHIVVLQDVISIDQSSCTSKKRSVAFFWRADGPEVGGSDSVEFSWCIIHEKMEHSLGRCYWGQFPYIGPRWYEIQAWSLGWHWYILPCNQVPDTQQM